MSVKLDNTCQAWFNYFINTQAKFADLGLQMSVQTLSGRLSEYGGVVVDLADSNGWQPYFRTEEEMTHFVLRWA